MIGITQNHKTATVLVSGAALAAVLVELMVAIGDEYIHHALARNYKVKYSEILAITYKQTQIKQERETAGF